MHDYIVKRWEDQKEQIRAVFTKGIPISYNALVKTVISMLTEDREDYDKDRQFLADPTRIHEIDDGNYQGTLLYVIGKKGYQPDEYWAVRISYGSCSGCDTLEAIHMDHPQHNQDYTHNEPPTKSQVAACMMLALHIVQGLREI